MEPFIKNPFIKNPFIGFVVFSLFIFNIVLVYLPYTEWVGFYLLFMLNVATGIFLFQDTLSITNTLNYWTLAIYLVAFVALYLVVMSITNRYSYYSKNGVPLQYPKEQANVLSNFRFMYVIFQFIIFGISAMMGQAFNPANFLYISISLFFLLIVWVSVSTGLNLPYNDISPFRYGMIAGLFMMFILLSFTDNKIISLATFTSTALSVYLVLAGYFLYSNSTYIME